MGRMVRVNEKNYRKLHQVAGKLQQQLGTRVSLDDALGYLLSKGEKRLRQFWKKVRQKRELGLSGRGPARRVKRVKNAAVPHLVHLPMNRRFRRPVH